jgi:hypothetical protein
MIITRCITYSLVLRTTACLRCGKRWRQILWQKVFVTKAGLSRPLALSFGNPTKILMTACAAWVQHFTDYGHKRTFVAATLGVETREGTRKWL